MHATRGGPEARTRCGRKGQGRAGQGVREATCERCGAVCRGRAANGFAPPRPQCPPCGRVSSAKPERCAAWLRCGSAVAPCRGLPAPPRRVAEEMALFPGPKSQRARPGRRARGCAGPTKGRSRTTSQQRCAFEGRPPRPAASAAVGPGWATNYPHASRPPSNHNHTAKKPRRPAPPTRDGTGGAKGRVGCVVPLLAATAATQQGRKAGDPARRKRRAELPPPPPPH